VAPTVVLLPDHIEIHVDGDDAIVVNDVSDLAEALRAVSKDHEVNGSWILSADSRTLLERMVAAMDAARAANFRSVTLAGGAL